MIPTHPITALRRRRRGLTLIELLFVITMTGIVLGVTGMLLHSVLKGDNQVRQDIELAGALDRLSVLFRGDVHAAAQASRKLATPAEPPAPVKLQKPPPAKPTGLRLVIGADRHVEYRAVGSRVVRWVWKGEKIVHRDTFPLPQGFWGEVANIVFEVPQSPADRMTAIVIQWRPTGSPANVKGRSLRIEAALGISQSSRQTPQS